MKALLFGLLVASPSVAVWVCRHTGEVAAKPGIHAISNTQAVPAPQPVVRVPVEVLSKGSAPQWVYVQVGNQAVPEPGMISLLALTSLLLVFRRQRS